MNDIEKAQNEGFLWDVLFEGDKDNEDYVMTCSVDSNIRCNNKTIELFGLVDYNDYTIMEVKEVFVNENSKQKRFFLKLRNPMGKGEWMGPWHDKSDAWRKYPYINEILRNSNN